MAHGAMAAHPPPVLRPWTASLVLLALGCGSIDTGSVAHRTAARLLECEPESTELTALSSYRYRGEGCGRSVMVACTAAALEPQCLAESELATAGAEEEEPASAGASEEVEAHIRTGLEARRDDVLACVGRDRVAVRVGYAPDGSVDVSLQGALHETPEERCVQDTLEGVRVAGGASGTVVHLLD
jgi:hypothetical protein